MEAEAYLVYVSVSANSTLCLGAGETLQDERVNGGAFIGSDGLQFPHKLIPVSAALFVNFYLFLILWLGEKRKENLGYGYLDTQCTCDS